MSQSSNRPHSPPPPPRREEDRFSRANFGPLPKRHDADLIALGSSGAVGGGDSYIPPPVEEVRHRAPMPVRERDLVSGAPPPPREARDDRSGREDRGRRPPPHWEEEDRPKRRRSPSPVFSSHRPRRYSPEPLYAQGGPSLPDPASLPNQLTFKQFGEWFRANHPSTAKADEEEFRRFKEGALPPDITKDRVGMGKRYERYRKEYTSRQLFSLYLMHRSSPWFVERYSTLPEDETERKRINRLGRVPNAEKYLDELKAGKHDHVSYDQPDDATKRPTGSRRYSELEEPEGLDKGLGDSTAEDTGRIEIPPLPNQVFIKSVPPTISRKELEQLFGQCDGFEYLAITEPSVKKAFHRVAWAQYAEGVDVHAVVKKLDESKISGFIFHMGVNTAGTIGRLRYAPPISNTLDRLIKDGAKAKALAIKLEDDLVDVKDEAEGDVAMKDEEKKEGEAKVAVGKGLRERGSVVVQQAVEKVLEKEGLAEGDGLSEEQKTKRAKITLDHWISYLRQGLSTCYYCVAPMSFTEELQRKCVGHLRSLAAKDEPLVPVSEESRDVRMGDEPAGGEEAKAEPGVEGDESMEDKRETGTDGANGDAKRERERVAGARGGREGRGEGGRQSQEERWEEYLDFKLGSVLREVDVVDCGGRDLDEELKKLTAPMIKQEEANKYRCKECSKLFKAPEFVMKHITVKHGEGVQVKLDEFAVFNNFVLDPQHLQPTPQVPAAIEDELPAITTGAPLLNPTLAFNPDLMPGAGSLGTQQQQQQMMLMMMQMQQAMMMQMQAGGGGGGAAGGMGAMGGVGGMGGMGGGGAGGRGMGAEGRGLANRVGGYAGGGGGRDAGTRAAREPLPPPPAGAEDPRAKRGRVSYMDLDEMGGGGDGGLPY